MKSYLFGLSRRPRGIYLALLVGAILLGALLNLVVSGTPPPTKPVNVGEMIEFKAAIHRHSSL